MKGKQQISPRECNGRLQAIGDALYVIGGKWKLRVIVALREENKRFNEIQRSIEGISAKVLSAELKDLEINGFIKRTVHTGVPVTVEYELTDYADTLDRVLEALSDWGKLHREHIKADRSQRAEPEHSLSF